MNYAISTLALIVYFILVALAAFSLWAAPAVVMGIVALVIAIALIVGK